jgi:hypothetical protein
VSLTHDDVVPHIIIQSSRLRLGEFETHPAKRVLQHNRAVNGLKSDAFGEGVRVQAEGSMRISFCILGLAVAWLVLSSTEAHSRGFAWFFSHLF